MQPNQGDRWILVAAALLLASSWMPLADAAAVPGAADPVDVKASFGKLPIAFETNQGQADSRVRYLARAPGYALYLTGTEAVLDLPAAAGTAHRGLRMRLVGANAATVSGKEELPGKSNYFIGNDPASWQRNVPTYARVEYLQVYRGIDLDYYGNQGGRLEYDFIVSPGADPRAIRFKVAAGAGRQVRARLAANGDLVMPTEGGEIRLQRPLVYQANEPGGRTLRSGHFVLSRSNEVRFEIGRYDHARALIIDPVLSYSTYLGGSNGATQATSGYADSANAIAVDSSGNVYLTGVTAATDFPTFDALEADNPTHAAGLGTAFVTKINAAGTTLVYSTYLGGSVSNDIPGSGGADKFFNATGGVGIAVDAAGNAYVTGNTTSANFPTVNPFQLTNHATDPDLYSNAFVAKLNASGSALVYSTYLGGSFSDAAYGIAVDAAGSAYVVGTAESADFPTVNPLQGTNNAFADGTYGTVFVTKFNPSGSALVYSTYLGGSVSEIGSAIAVDSAGNAYVTGYTNSTNFPTVNAFQPANHASNGGSAFVSKINSAGSALLYSTYLGGSRPATGSTTNAGYGIAVDSAGSAYVTGATGSADFPTVNPFQATLPSPGYIAAFVSKFAPSGTSLVYSTYLGGLQPTAGYGIAVNGAGEAFVTGHTFANDFPTVAPVQSNFGEAITMAFVSQFSAAGSALEFSTYLGGVFDSEANSGANQYGAAIALDSAGNAYVAGSTNSTNFPTVNPLQASNREVANPNLLAANYTAFVAKISMSATAAAPTVTISGAPASITLGGSSTLTWSSTGATACTASGAWSGTETLSGSEAVTPKATGSQVYTLTCTGAGGSASAAGTIAVQAATAPPPTVTLSVSPTSITLGSSASLTWSSTNATACTTSGGWSGAEGVSGTLKVTPTATGKIDYDLSCTGSGGSASAAATLAVNAATPPSPTVTIAVNPTSINLGQSATVTWTSTHVASCTASGAWSGSRAASGSVTVTPTVVGNASFILTCAGTPSGSAAGTATLSVRAVGTGGGGGSFGPGGIIGLAILLLGRRRRTAGRP